MSDVSRLQSFANVLMGTANSALDAYGLWRQGELGPRLVSEETDAAANVNLESLMAEGLDAIPAPVVIEACDWWGDLSLALNELHGFANSGIADILMAPAGKDAARWVLELLAVADELLAAVKLAGLVRIDLSVEEFKQDGFAHGTLQEDWQTVRKIPRLADVLWKARGQILNQVEISTPVAPKEKAATPADNPAAADHGNHGDAGGAGGGDDDNAYRELAKWAADKLKRKQRRMVELLITNNGRMRMADLNLACEWPGDQFGRCKTHVNKKLRKAGWFIERHDNEARLRQVKGRQK